MDDARLSNPDFGKIPESGIYSVLRWAVFCQTTDSTINDWIAKYEIPYFAPGKSRFIRAQDFLAKIPYFDRQDE